MTTGSPQTTKSDDQIDTAVNDASTEVVMSAEEVQKQRWLFELSERTLPVTLFYENNTWQILWGADGAHVPYADAKHEDATLPELDVLLAIAAKGQVEAESVVKSVSNVLVLPEVEVPVITTAHPTPEPEVEPPPAPEPEVEVSVEFPALAVTAKSEHDLLTMAKAIGKGFVPAEGLREGKIYQAERESLKHDNVFYRLKGEVLEACVVVTDGTASDWKPALDVVKEFQVELTVKEGDKELVKTGKALLEADAKDVSLKKLTAALQLKPVEAEKLPASVTPVENAEAKGDTKEHNVLADAMQWGKENLGLVIGGTIAVLGAVIGRMKGLAGGTALGAVVAAAVNQLTGNNEHGTDLLAEYHPDKMPLLPQQESQARGA